MKIKITEERKECSCCPTISGLRIGGESCKTECKYFVSEFTKNGNKYIHCKLSWLRRVWIRITEPASFWDY